MEFPHLPSHLSAYLKAQSEKNLVNQLKKSLPDLIDFFIAACEDETFCDEHPWLIENLLLHLTLAQQNGAIVRELLAKLINVMRKHYAIISERIPRNLSVHVAGLTERGSSLILAASSPYFEELIKADEITIPLSDEVAWTTLSTYMKTGETPDLWKKEKAEIYRIIQTAIKFNLYGLAVQGEEIVKRYINQNNVVETLIFSFNEKMIELKKACQEFTNQKFESVRLPILEDQNVFPFEFLRFDENALSFFHQLSSMITLIKASESLPSHECFPACIQEASKLNSLDISGSDEFTEHLLNLPLKITQLDLSLCFWLTPLHFHKITGSLSKLTTLSLKANTHLNFTFWHELSSLKNLKILDISKCIQITNEDFQILLSSNSNITDLFLEDCVKISERGFFDIPLFLPDIYALDLSRCQISDISLLHIADKCKNLTELKLERCSNISEKGIIELVRIAKSLRILNLTAISTSKHLIKELTLMNPIIEITS